MLYRLFEIQAEVRPPAAVSEPGAPPPVAAGEDIRALIKQQGLLFEGLHDSSVQALNRLEDLKRDVHNNNNRLSELKANLPETGSINKAMQRFHKETTTGLERIQVTQAGLVSAMEALKANDRRGNATLEELRSQLTDLATRVIEAAHTDNSADPTVVGAPDTVRRLGALTTLLENVQGTFQRHTTQLDQQRQRLDAQAEELQQAVQSLLTRPPPPVAPPPVVAIAAPPASEALSAQALRDVVSRAAGELLSPLEHRLDAIDVNLSQLETLAATTDALAAQLGELQADVGLVLKARPVRGAGRSQSPYDANLADEYYANLLKLIRVLVKNDKASTYAMEAIQYLHESLQVQASLTALLSSTEFALRVSPRALEEGVVKPLLRELGAVRGAADPGAGRSSGVSLTGGDGALRLPRTPNGYDSEIRGEDLETLREVRPHAAGSARWDEVEALHDQDLHAGELEQADISLPSRPLR